MRPVLDSAIDVLGYELGRAHRSAARIVDGFFTTTGLDSFFLEQRLANTFPSRAAELKGPVIETVGRANFFFIAELSALAGGDVTKHPTLLGPIDFLRAGLDLPALLDASGAGDPALGIGLGRYAKK